MIKLESFQWSVLHEIHVSHLFFFLFSSHDPTGHMGQEGLDYIEATIVVEQDVE